MTYRFSDKIKSLKPSAIREIFKYTADPSVISFAAGSPAPDSFPAREMKTIADELFDSHAATALQYGITEGYAPLREKLRARLRERFGIHTGCDDVIVTTGGQQGIDLTCKVLCNEGDTVLCEAPSFIGALNAFRSYNVRLRGIDMESDGIDINALEHALLTEKNVKLLYLIPTFQNPSTVTMSEQKRRLVYALCEEHGVIILEDDPYSQLRFGGEAVPPIKSMDTAGIVVYCSSFSKIISAGIRVGYLCAPAELAQKIVVAKQTADVHTNLFFQMVIDRYLGRYDLDAHIESICNLYRAKSALMGAMIEQYMPNVAFTAPQGGIFIWCKLPDSMDAMAFGRRAIARKVAIVPGNTFLVDEDEKSSYFRLNYTVSTDEQIERGIQILGDVLNA